jgi:hypothetical protein
MPATMDSRERTVRGLHAACLSLLAGLGHLYIGERKGFKILPAGFFLLAVARYWWSPAAVAYLALVIWSAGDVFLTVRRGRSSS